MVRLNIKVPKEQKDTWKLVVSYFYKSALPLICGMISTYLIVLGHRVLGLMFLMPALMPLVFDLQVKS